MLTIRNNIFETNSSSTHGISLEVPYSRHSKIKLNYEVELSEDDSLVINGYDFSEFDFETKTINEKISLCLMVMMVNKYDVTEFIDFIKQKTGAKKVINNIKLMDNAFITTELLNTYLYILNEDMLGDDQKEKEVVLFEDIIKNPRYLEYFIFGEGIHIYAGKIYC